MTGTNRAPPVLLEVRGLEKRYHERRGLGTARTIYALNGVSLRIQRSETVAVVGESGSGKTTLGRLILRLEDPTAGSVWFDGTDLATLAGADLRRLRRRIQVVFQDPYASLNPRLTVGSTVAEGMQIHRLAARREIPGRVAALLEDVGLQAEDAHRYPHEFSGGQRQRIAIARALSVEPDLVVCDEPVSALDVSVQAQILALLQRLQRERGISYLLIAHDLAVVRQVAHRTIVLYHGTVMEEGPTAAVVETPRHPYTQALVSAVPRPDAEDARARIVLAGEPSPAYAPPAGCPFASRCFHPRRDERCLTERPQPRAFGPSEAACHHAE